jgi:hypothetical protein
VELGVDHTLCWAHSCKTAGSFFGHPHPFVHAPSDAPAPTLSPFLQARLQSHFTCPRLLPHRQFSRPLKACKVIAPRHFGNHFKCPRAIPKASYKAPSHPHEPFFEGKCQGQPKPPRLPWPRQVPRQLQTVKAITPKLMSKPLQISLAVRKARQTAMSKAAFLKTHFEH